MAACIWSSSPAHAPGVLPSQPRQRTIRSLVTYITDHLSHSRGQEQIAPTWRIIPMVPGQLRVETEAPQPDKRWAFIVTTTADAEKFASMACLHLTDGPKQNIYWIRDDS